MHFLIHSINENASSLATDAMAFGLPIRWRRITRGSAASRDVFPIPKISYITRHCKFVSQGACIFLKKQKNSKRQVLFKLEKKNPTKKKFIVEPSFHKLDNNKWEMHTGARTRKQKYISIYISLYMKTFLKTGVYIYTVVFKKVNISEIYINIYTFCFFFCFAQRNKRYKYFWKVI